MKYLILLFTVFTIFSCTKEDRCQELNCDLLGEWTWTKTCGTIAGRTWTPESTGYEIHIKINESKISFFKNDTLTKTYEYEVFETDTLYTHGTLASFIKYNKITRRYSIENGTLGMYDLCFDCLADFFEKN